MTNEHIRRVLEYIEEHLTDDSLLDNTTLASIAGYSKGHFLRVFNEVIKLTPADYIRKRRIQRLVRAQLLTKVLNCGRMITAVYGHLRTVPARDIQHQTSKVIL